MYYNHIYHKQCRCRTPAIPQLPTDNAILTLHSSECVLSYNVQCIIHDTVYYINVGYIQAWVCHFPQQDSKEHRYPFPHYLLILVQTGLLYLSACIHVTGYTIILTSLHTPLFMSSSHTSLNTFSPSPHPPITISNGCCCPVGVPAMQQAAWYVLAGGLSPVHFSLVQCCMDMFIWCFHAWG